MVDHSPGTPPTESWANRPADSGPAEAGQTPRPHPAGLRSTDFLAAHRRNRRATFLLLLLLSAIAGLLGYLVGAWLESHGAVWWPSAVGLGLGAILIAASFIWSGISLAFGD